MQAAGFGVLGPLTLVQDDGRAVSPGGPKQRELLGLLLLHRNTPLSAERLVDALWGDPPAGAEATLRSHVSHLRRRLADTLPSCTVETGPLGYALATGGLAVDADLFQDLLGRGQESFGLGRADEAAQHLRAALALWRGPPWRELEHLDAAVSDAARLEELRLVTHEVLVAAELARGRHREVVAEVEALHAAHPFRERFAGQLMLALYRSGRQADALAAYTATRERLADDLGLDPGPELQSLSHAILRQDPDLAAETDPPPAGRPRSRAPRPREVPDGVLAALADGPLDGRADERARLLAAWRGVVDDGAPRLLLVSGDAGIGKSRLVAEVVRAAVEDRAAVLVGRCDASDVPYHPVADALRSSAAARAELTEPLERILGAVGTPDDEPASGDGRPPAYAAARNLLDRLAGDGPVLVVIEDAEGIDRSSGRLLRHLAARLPVGAALLVAYRDPPGGRRPALLELLGDAGLRALTEHVVLGPLDEQSIDTLVRHVLPDVDASTTRRLWEHTGGNPYFAAEVARSWADGDPSLELPAALRDVLAHRMGTLSARCRSMLTAAAVLGREVDPDLVARVVDQDEDEVAAALEEAVTAGLLVESRTSWSSVYAFPHELMRDATERDVPATARRRLHRRAADAVATRPGQVAGRAATVARHLRAAGHLCAPDEAADWCLRAAREAKALHAWDEAIEHAERAVELLAALTDRAAYAAAAEETARLRIRGSRGFDRVVALREAALAVQVETRDPLEIGRAHSRLGAALSLHHSVMDVPRALEHLDAARRLLGDDVSSVHTGRTQAAMFGVRTDVLEEAAAAVVAYAERHGRPDLAVGGGWARGWALFNRGALAAGRASDESTWQGAHALADPFLSWSAVQAPALRQTVYLLDPGSGRSWCRRGLGQPRFGSTGHSHVTLVDQLGMALLTSGETDAARAVAGDLPTTALTSRYLRLREGHWEEAEADWAAAVAADESAGDLHDAAVNSLWLAEARELLGDLDGAEACLRRAATIAAEGPQLPVELAARAELARILSPSDRDEAAAQLARCAEILSGGEDYRGRRGRVHLAEAHVHAATGAAEDAARALDHAEAVFRAMRLPWHLAEAAVARMRMGGGSAADAAAAYRGLDAPDRWVDEALHRASTPLPHPSATVAP